MFSDSICISSSKRSKLIAVHKEPPAIDLRQNWKCRFLYFWLKVNARLETNYPSSANTFVVRISESHPLLFIVFCLKFLS